MSHNFSLNKLQRRLHIRKRLKPWVGFIDIKSLVQLDHVLTVTEICLHTSCYMDVPLYRVFRQWMITSNRIILNSNVTFVYCVFMRHSKSCCLQANLNWFWSWALNIYDNVQGCFCKVFFSVFCTLKDLKFVGFIFKVIYVHENTFLWSMTSNAQVRLWKRHMIIYLQHTFT